MTVEVGQEPYGHQDHAGEAGVAQGEADHQHVPGDQDPGSHPTAEPARPQGTDGPGEQQPEAAESRPSQAAHTAAEEQTGEKPGHQGYQDEWHRRRRYRSLAAAPRIGAAVPSWDG